MSHPAYCNSRPETVEQHIVRLVRQSKSARIVYYQRDSSSVGVKCALWHRRDYSLMVHALTMDALNQADYAQRSKVCKFDDLLDVPEDASLHTLIGSCIKRRQ